MNGLNRKKMGLHALKEKVEEVDIQESEKIYEQIDKLEERIDEKIEEVLNEVLPTAFAVIKDTARRFNENEQIEVTANDFDRDLAAKRNSIKIKGEKAIWNNKWMAGEAKLPGTWFITMFSLLVVLCCTGERLLKWQQVKEKHWWLLCLFS